MNSHPPISQLQFNLFKVVIDVRLLSKNWEIHILTGTIVYFPSKCSNQIITLIHFILPSLLGKKIPPYFILTCLVLQFHALCWLYSFSGVAALFCVLNTRPLHTGWRGLPWDTRPSLMLALDKPILSFLETKNYFEKTIDL